MVVFLFQHPAFVWACAAFAGGCLAAAVAVGARAFWAELAAKFLRMPAAGKAALVAFVAVATAVAQKPGNVATDSTDSHGLSGGEEVSAYPPAKQPEGAARRGALNAEVSEDRRRGELSTNYTDYTESQGFGEAVSDRIDKIDRRIEAKETPCLSVSLISALSESNSQSVTDDDIARGFRLTEVRTNETVSYEMPTNGTLVGTWHLTDAYEAVVRVGAVTSLWAHVWGKARPQLKNASNELVAVGAPMFARHGVSRLWTAATTNGSVLLTWESFFLGNPYAVEARGGDGERTDEVEARGGGGERTANLLSAASQQECLSNHSPPQASTSTFSLLPISAQLELFASGDFIARSNEIERVYRRVNPDDWDDDGISNDEDDDPRIAADETQFGPHQDLSVITHSNNYYWVDLIVPQANALVTFTGDGASNLADPSFVAKAGEVNRVTLLIGKTYRVTCPLPFRIAAKSSDEIEESWQSDGSLLLHWPVLVSSSVTDEDDSSAAQRAAIRQTSSVGANSLALSPLALLAATTTATLPATRSHTFVMSVVPSGLGGLFDWTTHCCSISGTAYSFEQTCRDGCACSGCSTEGFFEYEGYQLRVYGPSCPCLGSPPDDYHGDDEDDDPPTRGVSAYFTKSVIFLEDEYENAPGETVPWQSTETKLVCSAAGGPFGGRVKIEIEGADNLIQYTGPTLPFEQSLEAGEDLSFKIRYRATKESGAADDIKVTATFVENETEWEQESLDTATAIRLEFKPEARAPENRSEGRHRYGVRELVRWTQEPSAPKVSWSLTAGEIIENEKRYRCPLNAANAPLTAYCRGSEYTPAISVVEPQLVRVRNPSWDDFDAPVGEAGSIVMLLPLYICPLDVSFANIAVEEVPYEDHPNDGDVHTGYFARNDLALWWHHTRGNGAGIWRNVREFNRMGGESVFDQAGVTETLSRVNSSGLFVDDPNCGWSDGRIVMATPFGWNETNTQGEDRPFKMFATDVRAVLELQTDGTFGVEKLDNKVIRHVAGEVFLNGVRQK